MNMAFEKYKDEVRNCIGIARNTANAISDRAIRVTLSLIVHEMHDDRQAVAAFLKECGFRLRKWEHGEYKNKPGGIYSLELSGGAELVIYDNDMIGNEFSE